MALITIERETNLNKVPISVDVLHGMMFSKEAGAHKFLVTCTKDGEQVQLTGTVTAYVLLTNGHTQRLESGGTTPYTGIENGKAWATLHQACYAVPGRFQISIFVTDTQGVTTCVYAAVGVIQRSATNNEYDPGDAVPTINDLEAWIAACQQATEDATAAANAVPDLVAETFATNKAYTAGSYVYYNGSLYRFTADHAAGAWTGSDATEVKLGNDVADLKSALSNIIGISELTFVSGYYKNKTVGGVVNTITPSNGYVCAIAPCNPGDIVVVRAYGASDARAWAYLDADYKVILPATANANASGIIDKPPLNAAYITVNNRLASLATGYNAFVGDWETISRPAKEESESLRLGFNDANYILSTMQVRGHVSSTDVYTDNKKYCSSDRFECDTDINVLVLNENYNVILHNCTDRVSVGSADKYKQIVAGKQYVLSFNRVDGTDISLDEIKGIAILLQSLVVQSGTLTSCLDTRTSYYIYTNSNITDLPNNFDNSNSFMYNRAFANNGHMFMEQTLNSLSSPKTWKRIVRTNGTAWNNWWSVGATTSVLASKKVSIYGDSISTFAGYIPEGNATYYTGSNAGVSSVNDTWWKKTIDALGLSLLVNNSWSGRAVSSIRDGQSSHATDAGYKEANVLQLKSGATLPDIIIIKLGINDFNSGAVLGDYDGSTALPVDPTKFLDAYAIMLNLIMTNFPLADVYCCTLMQCERSGSHGFPEINSQGNSLGQWNEGIKKLANAFGAKVLNHDVCGLTYYNLSTYMGDYSSGSGLHPNAAGHSLIANQTIHQMDNAVRTRY